MDGTQCLGKKVECLASGFTGIAIQYLEHLNGNIQVALQPKATEGASSLPDAVFLDQQMLKLVNEDIVVPVTEVTNPTEFKLGEELTDEVTGFTGIATMKAVYINGCENFYIEPKCDPKSTDKKEVGRWVSPIRLKRKGKGKSELIASRKEEKPTGGPGMKVPRMAVQR